MPLFSQSQVEAIADALGDTDAGLTGSEISHLLKTCKMSDLNSNMTKRHRLYTAFAASQNSRQDRRAVLAFIRHAMKPERYTRAPDRYEPMRARLNRALSFCGLKVDEAGILSGCEAARTLTEAQRRAEELRADLTRRGIHPDVLRFCREELLSDNYFHAVLEAVKSVAGKIRNRTGLTDDGDVLVSHALAGNPPLIALNQLRTLSEQGEQRGFANLVRGVFGMFRNPTAHEARIHWQMTKEDAEDLLSIVSLIHRRLDTSHIPPRIEPLKRNQA
jgi:uncharacterized protein (TIGR02391 family)